MREFQTPVGIEFGTEPKVEGNDHKCIVCAYTGTRQERYDHEVHCLEQAQVQVKHLIKAEKDQMRMGGRPR